MLLFVTCVMELFLAAVLHLVVLLLLLVLIPTFDFFGKHFKKQDLKECCTVCTVIYCTVCMYRSQLAGEICLSFFVLSVRN